MSIPFNQIPGSLRLPGARFEINTGERPYQGRSRIVYIAPMLTGGTATPGSPVRLPGDPVAAFGAGSIASEVAILARRQAALFEIWMLPVADATGTKGTGVMTVTAVPPAGQYRFWVCGRERFVTVVAADTLTTLAAKLAAAAVLPWYLPGSPTALAMPVTSGSAVAVATLTAKHNGPELNASPWIDFATLGQSSALAAAVTVTYPVVGTGSIDMAAALASLVTLEFDWLASVYDDTSARAAISNFLTDRWSPMKMKYGWALYARQDTYGALATFGVSLNDFRSHTFGFRNSPSPKWAILAQAAADLAAYYDLGAALSEAQVLARPPSGRVLRDVATTRDRLDAFSEDERNALYFDGISPLVLDAGGNVTFELVCTSYRTDPNGLEDSNFLWINYGLIYVYFVRFMRNFAWSRHAQTSLVGDAEPPRTGQTRPKDLRETFTLGYMKLRNEAGIVEDVDGFVTRLEVERSSDPVRANVLAAVDAANPFHVLATNVQASAQFQS